MIRVEAAMSTARFVMLIGVPGVLVQALAAASTLRQAARRLCARTAREIR